MVAGVVQRVGVDLGPDLPVNLEDPAFNSKPVSEIIATIKARNNTTSPWGWKFPRAAAYIEKVQQHLINPHYIIVWRDILANSSRLVRRGENPIDSLNHAHKIQKENIDVIGKLNGPCLLVSYEKSVLDPIGLYQQVSEFLGVETPLDESELLEFTRPGSYKN
ncbi:hypothetical protein GCM10008940_00640 [Microbulbifer agarilyticus]